MTAAERHARIVAGERATRGTPAITPEAIDADPNLTDEQRAELYALLFDPSGCGRFRLARCPDSLAARLKCRTTAIACTGWNCTTCRLTMLSGFCGLCLSAAR